MDRAHDEYIMHQATTMTNITTSLGVGGKYMLKHLSLKQTIRNILSQCQLWNVC